MSNLSDEQIEVIAERAAEIAIARVEVRLVEQTAKRVEEHFYSEIGKAAFRKVLLLIGAAVVGAAAVLAGYGHLK